jgi:hypothetical protein
MRRLRTGPPALFSTIPGRQSRHGRLQFAHPNLYHTAIIYIYVSYLGAKIYENPQENSKEFQRLATLPIYVSNLRRNSVNPPTRKSVTISNRITP